MAGPVDPELVYIFIDYSNVTHEGSRELNIANDHFNVDLNRLVLTVCNGRKSGGVFIAGSTPQTAPTPAKDELAWRRAEHHGFNVKTFPRNASNKEKKVDSRLTCDIMLTIRKNPGILVLVAGDSDYSVPLEEARKENWEIEIWFWNKGKSKHFSNFPYTSLNFHYKSFVYITGPRNRYTFEISSDIIKNWKWKNEPIMECYCALNLLCQFQWVNKTTAHLYFDNETHLKQARGWLFKKYPMLLKEQGRVGKSVKVLQDKKITEDIVDLPQQNTDDPLDDQYVFVDLTESIILK
ncbi:uncharacterized protein OCT59_018751 [Rhizophagus irregularis]|uniref:NYN domain-containing protein n=1 Tax=Rhizophagus irregularis (strain DAOM 197198w) TaxID=1432141 RepID=A0A015L785_RHIIW|nr:hypothetical protein RirG_105250 [Rhizophagus irregularis DAOM 197198w]UZO26534.1 hypothetical protein OCT59_018751 [Rhizophagus irregularis]